MCLIATSTYLDRVKLRSCHKHVVVLVVFPLGIRSKHGTKVVIRDNFLVLKAKCETIYSWSGDTTHLHNEIPPLFLARCRLHLILVELCQCLWCRKFREGRLEVLEQLVVDFREL